MILVVIYGFKLCKFMQKGENKMQSFTTEVQLPDSVNNAITKAVSDSFIAAKKQLYHEAEFPLYMNKKQTCSYLGVSYRTLMGWIKNNPDFPYSELDGVMRFNRDDVTEFMRNSK